MEERGRGETTGLQTTKLAGLFDVLRLVAGVTRLGEREGRDSEGGPSKLNRAWDVTGNSGSAETSAEFGSAFGNNAPIQSLEEWAAYSYLIDPEARSYPASKRMPT